MNGIDYETALAFVISLRPRMAVEDADAAARRLMDLNGPDPLTVAIEARDWPTVATLSKPVMDALRAGKKIQAIKELRQIMFDADPNPDNTRLKIAKDAVESSLVTEAVSA